MTRRFVFSHLALLCFAAAAFAAPNFSGGWKLNTAGSDFGPFPPPSKFIRHIEHHDAALKFSTTQSGPAGEVKSDISYQIDGQERTQEVNGSPVSGSARWDGDVLEIKSVRGGQVKVESTERWKLSPDGGKITITAAVQTPTGSAALLIVLERQSGD